MIRDKSTSWVFYLRQVQCSSQLRWSEPFVYTHSAGREAWAVLAPSATHVEETRRKLWRPLSLSSTEASAHPSCFHVVMAGLTFVRRLAVICSTCYSSLPRIQLFPAQERLEILLKKEANGICWLVFVKYLSFEKGDCASVVAEYSSQGSLLK